MSTVWAIDDESIPNTAFAHRRLAKGDTVVDLATGSITLSASAYTYREDGMSVYVSTAMEDQGVEDVELIDWSKHKLARVTVEVVRRQDAGEPYSKNPRAGTVAAGEEVETAGGVILDEASEPDDERIRKSHGLIRIEDRPPARTLWTAFRHKLIQGSQVKPSESSSWEDAAGDLAAAS
jgi:hypothetical protein